jgi:folate-dependent tRNA-U54 methylase TrmFO/GidA
MRDPIHIIGGGLAGSEATWPAALDEALRKAAG